MEIDNSPVPLSKLAIPTGLNDKISSSSISCLGGRGGLLSTFFYKKDQTLSKIITNANNISLTFTKQSSVKSNMGERNMVPTEVFRH